MLEHPINTEVYADKEAISTVIRNLVDNGIKFSNPGDRVHICSASTIDDRRIVVKITDTGIGMTPETIESLFTVPTYARRYGTHNEEGSGLGIQICRHYLQLNNSELSVESNVGQGTIFWFELDRAETV